jgi:hypothetical protein
VVKRKKSTPAKDKTVDDMRRFHAALDFSALWQDFYLSVKPNGMPKYKHSQAFVVMQGWTYQQEQFMTWLLGAEDNEKMTREFPEFSPQNWDEKRDLGGWYSEKALKEYGKSVRDKIDALESLRAAGNHVIVNSLCRVERLMQQLDKDMGGKLFLHDLSAKANAERAQLYVNLHAKLIAMLKEANDIYAKSHGINYNDMSGFERLLAAQMLTQKTEKTEDKGRLVLEKILDMTLEKSVKYNTPMPDGVRETALTVLRKNGKPVN